MPTGIYTRTKPVWNKGKKGLQIHSEKTRKKIGRSHLGKPSGMLGKKHSEKTLAKMNKAHKGNTHGFQKGHTFWLGKKRPNISEKLREANLGEKSNTWQGGISYEPYSIDWTETLKRSIRERDHYICQLCNLYGNTVHHIDYDKKNCNPNNLITLCRSCNGKVNFNRNYWQEYFNQFKKS